MGIWHAPVISQRLAAEIRTDGGDELGMAEDYDPLAVRSPWGALAAFLLVQCFGYVMVHGFWFYMNPTLVGADQIQPSSASSFDERLFFWVFGLMWFVGFVGFEIDMFARLSQYRRAKRKRDFIEALRRPTEFVKALIATVFLVAFVALSLGFYPFPWRPIPSWVLFAFYIFHWCVAALGTHHWQYEPKQNSQAGLGTAVLFVFVGGLFFGLGWILVPSVFYMHGMIGLFFMVAGLCQILIHGSDIPVKKSDIADGDQGVKAIAQ